MFRYITARPLWVNIAAGLVLIMVLGLAFILSLNWITHHGVAKTVPSVTGKKLAQAESFLESQGFDVVIQDSVYYDSLAPTVIIKQIPEPDAVVKINRTVYVTVNRTVPPDVDMPNLVGYSFRNAEMILKNLGLKVGDTTFRADFAKNSVLEQAYNSNPIKAGTKIKVGSSISLVIGNGIGSETIGVPKLIGLTYEEAKIMLNENGLIPGAVIADPLVKDTGNAYIYRQNPDDKDPNGRRFRIRPGQMIDVWLSVEKPVIDSTQKIKVPPADETPPAEPQ